MSAKPGPAKKKHAHAGGKSSNVVSALAVVGLVVLAVFDLFSPSSVPSVVYYGLIGAALGAKVDDLSKWIGGGHR